MWRNNSISHSWISQKDRDGGGFKLTESETNERKWGERKEKMSCCLIPLWSSTISRTIWSFSRKKGGKKKTASCHNLTEMLNIHYISIIVCIRWTYLIHIHSWFIMDIHNSAKSHICMSFFFPNISISAF